MKFYTRFFTICLLVTFNLFAEENISLANENIDHDKTHYISEDLFIYMHAGAGKNYRIIGTALAGESIQLTGENKQGFSEIINKKNKKGWIENKHITAQQGLRYQVVELKNKLSALENNNTELNQQLIQQNESLAQYKNEQASSTKQITQLTKELTATKAKLKTQDLDIQKEWFFNGAIVLVGGLLLGLIIPRVFSRRKSSMPSWQ